jgi:beta-phosphoglucomutase
MIDSKQDFPPNRPEAILWDMDGVLVDTSLAHYQTWKQVLAREGITYTYEMFKKTFGMSNPGFLRLLAGPNIEQKWIERVSQEKEELFRSQVSGQVRLFPGVRDWLNRFKARGIPQALASSAPPENITAIIQEVGLVNFFSALVSSEGLPGKPDPAIFLEAARRLNANPKRCLVLEDSLPGLIAAQAAQMKVIAVLTTQTADQMIKADLVVTDLSQMTETVLDTNLKFN